MSDIDVQYMKKNKIIGVAMFSLCVYGLINFKYDENNEINKLIITCLIVLTYYFINIYYPSYKINQ
jgi:hypothetical protein